AGKAMFGMMGVFAEFERSMIQERVRAGLRRARSEGKRLGRPKIAADLEAAIQAALRKKDRSGVRVIAALPGVSVNTVQRLAHGHGPARKSGAPPLPGTIIDPRGGPKNLGAPGSFRSSRTMV